jgi:hypothetical protein
MGNRMNIMIMDGILNNLDEILAKKIVRVGKTVISRLKGKPTVFKVKETQCMDIARDRH